MALATVQGLKSIRPISVVAEMRNKPVEYFSRKKREEIKSDAGEKPN
jgi:hypothetical protein